jgi:Family of unknown function (DUF6088)
MQTMKDQILARINRLGEGKVFSAKDFLDIATRGTIDVTLGDLTREGIIRRIGRGLYDLPKVNVALGGKLSPDIYEAARDSSKTTVEDCAGRGLGREPARPFHAGTGEDCLFNGRPKHRSASRAPHHSLQTCPTQSNGRT